MKSITELLEPEQPVLHLNLTAQWYDMIYLGHKKEEYRVLSDHWMKYFILVKQEKGVQHCKLRRRGKEHAAKDVLIVFSNGYAKDARQMVFELKSITIGSGRPEWGAPVGKSCFILSLGKRITANHDGIKPKS